MINMENREKLFKQYKSDCPQTIGETDTAFDNDNFIDWLCQQNKALLDEIEMLKFQLKAADSVNEQLTENQIPEYLIEFIDDVKHMIKLYNNSSHTRSEEYRDKLAEKLDDIRTIDLKP